MDLPEHIEVRRDVMMGKPCLKETRIPVYLFWRNWQPARRAKTFLLLIHNSGLNTSTRVWSTRHVWLRMRSYSLTSEAFSGRESLATACR